jgi:hypothetical protein
MKTVNRLFFLLILFILNTNVYPQDDIKECKSYLSLYNTIKTGTPASIKKTAWIEEFSLMEKSVITIFPVTTPDTGYKVVFEITNLEKGKSKEYYENGSVLGFMVTGCKGFEKNYKNFVRTSCYIITNNPEDACDAAENGITFIIDQNYAITGDLVLTFEKTCKSPNDPVHQPVKKPAVYLYPTEQMNISVKVEVNGNLTLTDPPYNTGWNVNAAPDGLIDNKYDYLFYEANLNNVALPEEGWIVEFKKLENWFDEYLPQLGLNTKEKNQFKEYWLKDLKKANYYEIKLLDTKFLDENMKLIISPEPQAILRLNFYFKPVFEYKEIKNPRVNKFERNGFTVIEWGGINAGEIKLLP